MLHRRFRRAARTISSPLRAGRIGRHRAVFARLVVLAAFAAVASQAALAVAPRDARSGPWVERAPVSVESVAVTPGEPSPAGASAARFVAVRGGEWDFRFAPTGFATMVQGAGVPLVPGRGNRLGAEATAGLTSADGDLTAAGLARAARAFLEAHGDLVVPGSGELRLLEDRTVTRRDGVLHSIVFGWFVDGVEVEDARVFVRVSHGNVTQFGAPFVGGRLPSTRTPVLSADDAIAATLEWSGDEESARIQYDPRLVLQSETDAAGALSYRLVWIVGYEMRRGIESREARVDAITGEMVGFRDANTSTGRVVGGVYERTITDPEIVVPFPDADVTTPTGTVTTDASGRFTYDGGELLSGLDGAFINTNCSDGCSNPAQPAVSVGVGSGYVDFGVGGNQEIGNGLSSRADRNAFYHINRVRRVARVWLPSLTWLDSDVNVNVNILDTCNATWNGGSNTANFYRAGGGCNNTGEIADVMYHEWGHGIDGNTNGGDGATGEATADQVSMHMTRSPLIGPEFRTTGAPVRNIDSTTTGKGLLTRSNIGSKCPGGPGPLGFSVHCEGELYGQSAWDLSQALVAKHGYHTGWRTSERLFFTSLPDADTYLPEQPSSVYDAYVFADDDDGNLDNGTPNGQEIFDAFDTHEIAGTNRGSSAGCVRPDAPVTSAVATDCAEVELSWTSVPGIDRYTILRGEIRLDAPFLPIADVASTDTMFVDTDVAAGVDYHYVVMAVATDGCESTVEAPVTVALDDQPLLDVAVALDDDTPAGNRSGFADPDEDVDLVVTLRNVGTAAAQTISGALASDTPGVTILDGAATWPDLAAGASAENGGTLRFTTDGAQLECGDTLRFRIDPSETTGCATDRSFFEVPLGTRVAEFADDFETDQGWAVDAVNSTATAGAWVFGDPDGTGFQPEDDVSDPGVNAWFTGTNAGGAGTDDVDGGVTILESPVIDLTGVDRAIVSYYRWFANRDTGEDAGDFFAADVSNDGGASWVNLETLGTNESAASWVKREFDLATFVALTSQMRLRFQAADGDATGNIIEAAIDEVRIERPECDDTPACFVEPTFAGADAAVGGASCAETTVSWQAASTNCQNATISYNVYRSTDPAFTPSEANRVAAELVGTSFADSLLEPGVEYSYIVRAFDSRSGEDSNVAAVSVVAPTAPDLVAPIFSGLETAASGDGCGETLLTWSAAAETCSGPVVYDVYRSTDPGFVPSGATLVAQTTSLAFVDATIQPGQSVTYVVRARDEAGNDDGNDVRATVGATILDATLLDLPFEPDAAGWSVVAPNTALTGNWEFGDPEGTEYQPADDHTVAGTNAWVTGLAANGGGGGNDVDDGTTTLLSASYDLSAAVDPTVRYFRWFTNDQGGSPAEDPLTIEVSNDDGANWVLLEEVTSSALAWVESEIAIAPIVTPTSQMRFRFTALDAGAGGSLVEAAIDDFALFDRDQGCNGCATPVGTVGTIVVTSSGDDVVLDWAADPAPGSRFAVYVLDGPDFSQETRIGTTDTRSFTHVDAALASSSFFYRVTAIDACGNESELK